MHNPPPVSWHQMPGGYRCAYRFFAGAGSQAQPAIVFLPGYKSDMAGAKAGAVLAWAQARGQACLLLDYSGCGQSEGDFADGTLSRWRDEVIALIVHCGLEHVVLVGSSMGGWLMLLIAQALGSRVAGMVGIAAAPDFTDWGYDDAAKAVLAAGRVVLEDNPYGPEPTPIHPGFWADGQQSRVLHAPIAFDRPVRLLHGQADRDVPWDIALRLAAALRSADVQVHLIKDGDHRLSRDTDLAVLLAVVDQMSHPATIVLSHDQGCAT